RVADYIFKFFAGKRINEAFVVTGGQAMYLDDAVFQNKSFHTTCMHHEQAVGMSAEAYGRITGKPAIALITAGPGSVNIVTGLVGAWTDSSPMIIVSGQSNLLFVKYQEKTGIRQYGIQGINIRPLIESVTKFFVTVDDPRKILFYLQKAYHLATTGRPGPVWIDVPLDIQRMEVPNEKLEEFAPDGDKAYSVNKEQIKEVIDLISSSSRPIILAGQGVRLSKALPEFNQTINKLNMPVLTSRLGIDLINSDHKLYVGRPGNYGERAANFAIQNSDLMLIVGCRLATPLIGHNANDFGKKAKKIVVDIDQKELAKPDLKFAVKINSDAKLFLKELVDELADKKMPDFTNWLKHCQDWRKRYPVVLPEYKEEKPVNSYYFTDRLSEICTADDLILVDTGSCFHVASQAWKIKKGQRWLTTGGLSSMGYWAAGVGACLANNKKNTIVITGDGSFQMNIQELATIKHNNLPVKIFIFNNNGYLLIRHTQKNFMEGRLFGESPASGVWCPDALKVAKAYGIKGVRIGSIKEVDKKIKEVLIYDGPVICDVITPEWQLLIPRVQSEKLSDGTMVSRAYEDMFPYLEKDELAENMKN
ncbi:MAG: thiamine pyrophosphate-binding protein, partial [Candidatus Falkowbacteria bacterium]|nr:thiamine pyrophosphate-binding protein [Candidatus Falkowbacteria bacterium]